MRIIKKQLAIVLSVLLAFACVVSLSAVSVAQDEIAYAFSSGKWNWWGAAQGYVPDWSENAKALTRNYDNGSLTYDVSGASSSSSQFNLIQDKWQSLPAGDFYLNFTNHSAQSVQVKIAVEGGDTLINSVWVGAGSEKKFEFTNNKSGNFSISIANWNELLNGGEGLYTFSPVYYQPKQEETTVENPGDGEDLPVYNNVVYKFDSSKHSWSKVEGCNASWSWGSWANLSYEYNSNGSVSVTATEDSYNKFRQFQAYYTGVPATESSACIDITNNSNRKLKIKILTSGYTTPADTDLPTVTPGDTETVTLGTLEGGNIQILLMEADSQDSIVCKENIFTISPIYISDGKVTKYVFEAENTYQSDKQGDITHSPQTDGSIGAQVYAMQGAASGNYSIYKFTGLETGVYSVEIRARQTTGRSSYDIVATDDSGVEQNFFHDFSICNSDYLMSGTSYYYVRKLDGNVNLTVGDTLQMKFTINKVGGTGYYIDKFVLKRIGDLEQETPTYTVTIDGVESEVPQGEYVLPEPPSEIKGFVGYMCLENCYDSGDSIYVDGDIDLEVVSVGEISTENKAAARLNNVTGLRFYTKVDTSSLGSLPQGAVVEKGTYIGPANTFDVNNIKPYGEYSDFNCVDVKYTSNRYFDGENTIVGTISNIKESNYARDFKAVGYVKVTIGEFEKVVLSEVSTEKSIRYIASCYIDDYSENNLTEDEKTNFDLNVALIYKWAGRTYDPYGEDNYN